MQLRSLIGFLHSVCQQAGLQGASLASPATPSRCGCPPPQQCLQAQTERVWSDVASLTPDRVGQSVLVRARVHNVRGKGKSCFLVLRQATATVQAAMFVDDQTVSKASSWLAGRGAATTADGWVVCS